MWRFLNIGGLRALVIWDYQLRDSRGPNWRLYRDSSRNSHVPEDVYFGNTDKNDMMFTGVRGPCIMDEFSCVMSPGYPNPYPSGESCQIAVSPQNSAPIHVTNFSTTFGDYLSFDCKYFTGGMGPEGIIPRSTIHWKPASIGAGWRICPGHKA